MGVETARGIDVSTTMLPHAELAGEIAMSIYFGDSLELNLWVAGPSRYSGVNLPAQTHYLAIRYGLEVPVGLSQFYS